MLSQVGSVTTNGIQQKSDFRGSGAFADMPVWPNLLAAERGPAPARFRSFTGVRVFDRDYRNPRVYSLQRRIRPGAGAEPRRVRGFHGRQGRRSDALPELQRARHRGGGDPAGHARHDDLCRRQSVRAAAGRRVRHQQPSGTACIAAPRSACASASRSTISSRRTTCCRRTKTTTRTSAIRSRIASFNFYDLSLDYGPSDRDIRHKFNFFTYAELPQRLSWQRAHPGQDGAADHDVAAGPERRRSRAATGIERTTRTSRSTGGFSVRSASGRHVDIIPSLEMFNTFNNANNVNPLTTPALFNFDGFLRQGVGDPRQLQLAAKVTF